MFINVLSKTLLKYSQAGQTFCQNSGHLLLSNHELVMKQTWFSLLITGNIFRCQRFANEQVVYCTPTDARDKKVIYINKYNGNYLQAVNRINKLYRENTLQKYILIDKSSDQKVSGRVL